MKPSEKSEHVEKVLKKMFGIDRRKIIRANVCVPPPIGCGEAIGEFKDEASRREYSISGLCQECQDKFFG